MAIPDPTSAPPLDVLQSPERSGPGAFTGTRHLSPGPGKDILVRHLITFSLDNRQLIPFTVGIRQTYERGKVTGSRQVWGWGTPPGLPGACGHWNPRPGLP